VIPADSRKSAAIRAERSSTIGDWPDELDATPPQHRRWCELFGTGLQDGRRGRRGGRSGFGRGMRGITNRLSRWCADRTSWAAAAVDRRSGEWSDPQARERSAAVPTVCTAPRSIEPRSDTAWARPRAERQRSLWPGKARLTGAERQRSRGSSDEASYETIPEAWPRPTCSAPGSVRPARWGVGGAPEHPPFRVTPGGEHHQQRNGAVHVRFLCGLAVAEGAPA